MAIASFIYSTIDKKTLMVIFPLLIRYDFNLIKKIYKYKHIENRWEGCNIINTVKSIILKNTSNGKNKMA